MMRVTGSRSSAARRRDFIAAAAAAIGSTAVVRPAAAAPAFDYKVGFVHPSSDPVAVGFTQLASQVLKESGGRFNIRVFPNSALGGQDAMLAQLRSGALEFNLGSTAVAALVPAAGIDAVPFAFKSDDQGLTAADGALGAYVAKEIEAQGMVAFPKARWGQGLRQVTTSTKAIRTADDMAGLKIRLPSGKVYFELFRDLGAVPTPLALDQTYPALQTHLVDAQENPFTFIESLHFYEVQKYLSVTNHMWNALWLTANQEKWNALPADLQDIFTRNARKYALLQRRDQQRLDAATAKKLQQQGMLMNAVDPSSFRAKLAPSYQRWKSEFGATLWGLLEQYSGKLA